ncbi:MAG: hypothetical protein NTY94_03925 [Alphaproteobacteria bacterium]|nr:hypothetical protein [Alphaproteobacteria bacterium]
MRRRPASQALGLIRTLIASGSHDQAARSLTQPHTPPPPTTPIPPNATPTRRRNPTTSSSLHQPPQPSPAGWPRPRT